jgi:hypothetical protein
VSAGRRATVAQDSRRRTIKTELRRILIGLSRVLQAAHNLRIVIVTTKSGRVKSPAIRQDRLAVPLPSRHAERFEKIATR